MEMNRNFEPDLRAEIVCGKSAAGFNIGESMDEIMERISDYSVSRPGEQLGAALRGSEGWLYSEIKLLNGRLLRNLFYKNDVVRLDFNDDGILYQIFVGQGYEGSFEGVKIGDDLRKFEDRYSLEFDGTEDGFLLSTHDGDTVIGVLVFTNWEGPLEVVSEQFVEQFAVADYSLIKRAG